MKKHLTSLLAILAVIGVFAGCATANTENSDALAFPQEPTKIIGVSYGGQDITVSAWENVLYVGKPTEIVFHFPPIPNVPEIKTTQLLNIYAPESANENSPLILYVDNGGWFTNTKPVMLKDSDELPVNGSRSAAIGKALESGYVVVTYSCRGRNDSPIDGKYLGHSPATITDTKAAIRYLRYNDAVIPGDSDLLVVTGTSGGGALTTVLSASGNSKDYFESLYKLGAAGMKSESRSTVDDAVFAAIAYCPITDLPNADQAYEWVYGPIRKMYKEANLTLEQVNPNPDGMGAPTNTDQVFGDSVLAASDELAADFVSYFNSLGLKDEDGNILKADDGSLQAAIQSLMEKGVEKEINTEYPSIDGAPNADAYDWLTITGSEASIDWNEFLYWIGTEQSGLKTAPAFSNRGSANQHPILNEDNIFGTEDQAYSPFEFWSWNNNIENGNGVGKDDTGLDWEEYIETDAGKTLLAQMKMTNPVPYLNSRDGDSAPYWYVRHGMADRDTSFAVIATLYYSLINDKSVKDVNFNYAWLRPHSGDYDVQEAYDWLAAVLETQ